MIVKIQRSQPPSPQYQVLVYTEHLRLWWLGNIDPRVYKWMGDDQKMFAHAHVDGSEIVIDSEAPWQEW